MQGASRTQGFTLIQALLIAMIVSAACSIAFPAVRGGSQDSGPEPTAANVRQLAIAGIMYGSDYDDSIPILVNGPYRSLQDNPDGVLTKYGNERTDAWPLLLIPYVPKRSFYVDPTRGDARHIWSSQARAIGDPGYDPDGATYRNQNRFPMYGVNYQYLSPGVIPMEKVGASNAIDYVIGEGHTFTEADDPSATVYQLASKRYSDPKQGFFVVNAPGLQQVMAASVPYVVFWEHGPCGADWCKDIDPSKEGDQSSTNSGYFDSKNETPTTFLDGHVKIMTDVALAAGTNYLTATPNDGGRPNTLGAGCTITDKSKYLWNLAGNYYGA